MDEQIRLCFTNRQCNDQFNLRCMTSSDDVVFPLPLFSDNLVRHRQRSANVFAFVWYTGKISSSMVIKSQIQSVKCKSEQSWNSFPWLVKWCSRRGKGNSNVVNSEVVADGRERRRRPETQPWTLKPGRSLQTRRPYCPSSCLLGSEDFNNVLQPLHCWLGRTSSLHAH